MKPFLHKVYRLMAEEHISYQDACRIIGQHGAKKRRLNKEKAASLWGKIESVAAQKRIKSASPHKVLSGFQMKFDFSES